MILIIILNTLASSHQKHCSRYVVVTQPSSDAAHSCKSTLSQLIVDQKFNESFSKFLVRYFITAVNHTAEILFQSGVHQVAEITGCQPFLFRYLDKVIIKGQPNVTIDCLNRLYIHFKNIPKVIIQNVKFQNCICHQGSGIIFSTIIMHVPITAATIQDSKFTNSRLIIFNQRNSSVKPQKKEIIVIRNVVFEDCCNSRSDVPIILLYMNHSSGFLGCTIHGVIV